MIYRSLCTEDVHVYYCEACAKGHEPHMVKRLQHWEVQELREWFYHVQCYGLGCHKEILYPEIDMSKVCHDECPTWYTCQL